MTDRANVIRLDPEVQRHVRSRIARLPAVVHAFHEVGHKALTELLVEYFDATDDVMFDLADKALSNQDQNMYFDSMRELRVQRKSMESRFFEIVDEAFARLVGDDVRDTLKDDGELSADALSLVQNEDLEQLVALEDTVDRANREFSSDLYGLNKALTSMVSSHVATNKNPFGPYVICHGIMAQFKRLDVDVKAKLMLFKLFDKMVVKQLSTLFQQLYNVLSTHGLNSFRPNLEDSISDVIVGDSAEVNESSFGSDMTSQEDLLELLSFVQRLPDSASGSYGMDLERVLSSVQKRRGQPLALGCIESETIHLVQMLFQFIVDNDAIDGRMKELFCRMQVPVVKVALLDETFLTRQRHPARLLINELAAVALQCSGNTREEEPQSDPMYVLMKRTVDRIVNHFEKNIDIFKETLADFSAFVEKESRRAAVLEKRTIDAEAGKAKVEQARGLVKSEIDLRVMDNVLPEIVNSLIEGPWSNVLFVTGLKNGFTSSQWHEQVKVLTDLIWSVQPCVSKSDRQRLVVLIPGLITNLRIGLDSISYNPFEVSELFKQLEEIHLARMRGELLAGEAEHKATPTANVSEIVDTGAIDEVDTPLTVPESKVAVQGESRQEEPEAIFKEEMSPEDLDPEANPAADDSHITMVNSFSQGAWFGFQAEALVGEEIEEEFKDFLRCRLAAIIKQADKYIFVNRSGMKVTEKTHAELVLALKNGHLRPLDSSMLFDKALESVVTGLRKSATSMPSLHDKDSRQ